MKVIENVRKFISVMKRKLLCLGISIFRHKQQAALTVFIRNTLLALGYQKKH